MPNPNIRCKNCKNIVSIKDTECPHCHSDLKQGRLITFNPFLPFHKPNDAVLKIPKKEILENLRTYSSKKISGIGDVKEIMSGIRKILERYKDTKDNLEAQELYDKYKNLYFYCNWIEHNEISRPNFVVPKILKEIDSIVEKFLSSYSPEESHKIHELLLNFASLGELRNLLEQSSSEHDLNLLVLKEDTEGQLFWKFFILSVIDTKLSTKEELKHVESLWIHRTKLTPIHKDSFIEVSIPMFEELEGIIDISANLTNGDMFSAEIKLPEVTI